MKLTKNFRLREFTYSKTAKEHDVENRPNKPAIENIKLLCSKVLQPLRDYINRAININSGYRCLKLNELVGGSATSKHVLGQAADFYIEGISPFDIAKTVMELNLDFDQMILYPTFVHISYTDPEIRENRKQLLYNQAYKGSKI
jgi:uncharacterized protein YcbK (DUF882 family)